MIHVDHLTVALVPRSRLAQVSRATGIAQRVLRPDLARRSAA